MSKTNLSMIRREAVRNLQCGPKPDLTGSVVNLASLLVGFIPANAPANRALNRLCIGVGCRKTAAGLARAWGLKSQSRGRCPGAAFFAGCDALSA